MARRSAHAALLVYDTFLTIHRESRYIWTRRHAATTAIYLVARYSAISNRLTIPLIRSTWSGQSTQVGLPGACPWLLAMLTRVAVDVRSTGPYNSNATADYRLEPAVRPCIGFGRCQTLSPSSRSSVGDFFHCALMVSTHHIMALQVSQPSAYLR